MRLTPAIFLLMVMLSFSVNAALWVRAADADLTFQNAAQEQQYRMLIDEFRCPKCQNANLAGSDAPIAQDLKHKTYELIQQGQSNEQIRHYMIVRYGDFISYKPPIKRATWSLWFAPPLMLFLAFIIWLLRGRGRRSVTTAPLTAIERSQLDQLLMDSSNTSDSLPTRLKQELRDDG